MSISNTGYFYIAYGDPTAPSYPTLYNTNPWVAGSSVMETGFIPNTSGTPTSVPGAWVYYTIDNTTESTTYPNQFVSTFSTIVPSSNTNYTTLNNSFVYVYSLGNGGTSGTGFGGGGGGGFAACAINPTQQFYGGNNASNVIISNGYDWTQPNYSSEGTSEGTSIHLYSGLGSDATSANGGNGAFLGAVNTANYWDYPDSYIIYGSGTSTVQVVSSDIACCMGGVGGQPATGSTIVGESYNTLPDGSPSWISSSTVNSITMADGIVLTMSPSDAGSNSPFASILFAIFTPTATS